MCASARSGCSAFRCAPREGEDGEEHCVEGQEENALGFVVQGDLQERDRDPDRDCEQTHRDPPGGSHSGQQGEPQLEEDAGQSEYHDRGVEPGADPDSLFFGAMRRKKLAPANWTAPSRPARTRAAMRGTLRVEWVIVVMVFLSMGAP